MFFVLLYLCIAVLFNLFIGMEPFGAATVNSRNTQRRVTTVCCIPHGQKHHYFPILNYFNSTLTNSHHVLYHFIKGCTKPRLRQHTRQKKFIPKSVNMNDRVSE